MPNLLLASVAATSLLAAVCTSDVKAPAKADRSETGATEPLAFQDRNINVTNLYNDTCAKCHGVNGEGGGGGTKSLLDDEKFEQSLDKPYFDAIKDGVPQMGMEAYGKSMSDEAIWALVVHVRELQGKAYRAKKGSSRPNSDGVYKTQLYDYKVEDVLTGNLKTPWSIAWLADGRMLVTNRSGSIRLAKKDGTSTEVANVPDSVELGQGGMMEVAVHPDYATNGWVYLSIADPKKEGGRGAMTKIVRGKLKFDGDTATWSEEETIWEADQTFYNGAGIHFGGKIVFDKKGHIFFSVGERGGNMLAQKLENPFGKIYRLNDDGTVPKDNPFVSQAEGKPSHVAGIWSLGHRNQQGLTIDLNGSLWDTEHGPRGGDEVNLITPGANYGWPVIAFSINYNDTPFQTPWPKEGQDLSLPVFRWLPSIGASGLDVMRGSAFPEWKGDLIAAGLVGQNLDRFRMKDGKMVAREELLHGMGRVRDVRVGPDGFIYLVLNQPDKVVRLVPAK